MMLKPCRRWGNSRFQEPPSPTVAPLVPLRRESNGRWPSNCWNRWIWRKFLRMQWFTMRQWAPARKAASGKRRSHFLLHCLPSYVTTILSMLSWLPVQPGRNGNKPSLCWRWCRKTYCSAIHFRTLLQLQRVGQGAGQWRWPFFGRLNERILLAELFSTRSWMRFVRRTCDQNHASLKCGMHVCLQV